MKESIFISVLSVFLTLEVNAQVTAINIQLSYNDSLAETTFHVSADDMAFFKYDPQCSMDHGLYLKDRLPDGEYRVHFNDTLQYVAFYRNKRKDGKWIHYQKDGKESYIETYEKGKLKREKK